MYILTEHPKGASALSEQGFITCELSTVTRRQSASVCKVNIYMPIS